MKSLKRSTLLVRIRISTGGSPAVYMWLSRVSAVIDSGFGRTAAPVASPPVLRGGEPGGSVVVDETESSCSSERVMEGAGDVSLIVDSVSGLSSFLDRIFCLMRVCENVVLCCGGLWGLENSSTVVRIDLVISSRDVYGKQIFSTALIKMC